MLYEKLRSVYGKEIYKSEQNIYQTSREELGLTRDQASELIGCISADRIEKIESEKSLPHPDEILAIAKAYKMPNLCNYFCSHECPIGIKHVPSVEMKALSQITLEVIDGLNKINKEKERLIEITVDGQISEDEFEDFKIIQLQLRDIANNVDALKLWVEKTIADGKIDTKKWSD